MSSGSHNVPIAKPQNYIIDPANPRRAFHDRVEDRLHVRGRATDDTEHLGCCRLMLQGLAQFCVALLDLLEQPHVLDGNHSLVGEGLEQRDLLVRERTDFRPTDHDRADRHTLTQ
jgi:hypothetical protein